MLKLCIETRKWKTHIRTGDTILSQKLGQCLSVV